MIVPTDFLLKLQKRISSLQNTIDKDSHDRLLAKTSGKKLKIAAILVLEQFDSPDRILFSKKNFIFAKFLKVLKII